MSDLHELVRAAQAGDRSAFACLLDREMPSAYRAALAIVRSPEDARDVVQEASIRAWRELPRLRSAGAWPSWFRRISVRVALDERRHARHTRESRLIGDAWLDPTRPSADSDEAANLLSAFGRLSARDRALLALRFHLDLTVPEVAGALGIRAGTAKARIHRAIGKLRGELQDE